MPNLTLVNSGEPIQAVRSDKRCCPRVICDILLRDSQNTSYRAGDIGIGGLKYFSPERPHGELSEFFLPLPSGQTLKLLSKFVWMRRNDLDPKIWEVGVRFLGLNDFDRSYLHYVVNSLEQGKKFESLLFKPFSLIEDRNELGDLVNKIDNHELSNLLLQCVNDCNLIYPRPLYLWKWCYEGLLRTTFSSVAPRFFDSVITIKLFSIIFSTVIDDAADQAQDKHFHDHVLSQVFSLAPPPPIPLNRQQRGHIKTLQEMWKFVENYIQNLPRYSDFRDFFYFDYATLMHSTKYALLINKTPPAINEKEVEIEQGPGVHVMINATLDLMGSEEFDMREFGALRGIVLEAQEMCRISNWLATWEREVRESDFTSGVIAIALKKGVISGKQLLEGRSNHADIIEQIKRSDVEVSLMASWERHWDRIHNNRHTILSVDVEKYLAGVEGFFKIQIASKNMI